MEKKSVLVSGVSGFLGLHTAIGLLDGGYRVLGTVRNLDRVPELETILESKNYDLEDLEFAEADLLDKEVWFGLARKVDFILHVASPFPIEMPRDPDELIIPEVHPLRLSKKNQLRSSCLFGNHIFDLKKKEK
mgnify:CR=1 FL=1